MPPRLVSGGSGSGAGKNLDRSKREEIARAAMDSISPTPTTPTNRVQDDINEDEQVPRNSSRPGRTFCQSCITQDNDARVVYNGRWLLNGTSFQTTHSTTDRGAKVTFQFQGSRVVVFGTVPASNTTVRPPRAKYSVDGRRTVESSVPMANSPIQSQPFFQASFLGGGNHKLVIEVIDAETPYILQHFFVAPLSSTKPDGGSINGNANTTSDDDKTLDVSTPTPTITGEPLDPNGNSGTTMPSSIQWPDNQSSSDPSAHTLRILSGVLGALIALIVVGVIIFFFRRRQKKNNSASRFFSKFWKYSPRPRPDTVYTSFTGPESIQRNEPSFLLRGSSAFTNSDGPPSDLRVSLNPNMRFSFPGSLILPPLPNIALKEEPRGRF